MRRFIPRIFTGLRARLVLGFLVVVALALSLVFATLPRLLDSYFLGQAQEDLNRRTGQIGYFILLDILQYQGSGGGAPKPILEGDPPVAAQGLQDALRSSRTGVLAIAQQLAQANITVQIATTADAPDQIAYVARRSRWRRGRSARPATRTTLVGQALYDRDTRPFLVTVGNRRPDPAAPSVPPESILVSAADNQHDHRRHGRRRGSLP